LISLFSVPTREIIIVQTDVVKTNFMAFDWTAGREPETSSVRRN
jgi:hypothetical protein